MENFKNTCAKLSEERKRTVKNCQSTIWENKIWLEILENGMDFIKSEEKIKNISEDESKKCQMNYKK